MSNIKLDLSKFKHVKSDDKSTTLKHYEGHELKIAHSKLSKANKEALMAMGGAVKKQELEPKMTDGGIIDKIGKGLDDFADYVSGEKYPAAGSKVQNGARINLNKVKEYGIDKAFADGGNVTSDLIEPTSKIPDALKSDVQQATEFDPNPPYKNMVMGPDYTTQYQQEMDRLKNIPMADDQREKVAVENVARERNNNEYDSDARKVDTAKDMAFQKEKQSLGIKSPQQQPAVPPNFTQDLSQPVSNTQHPQVSNGTQSQNPTQQDTLRNDLSPLEQQVQGGNTQAAGINAQARALGQQGQAESLALKQQQDANATLQKTFKDKSDELDGYFKGYEQDMKNGYIDPEKYWSGYTAANGDKVPGHSRMAAAIGMLIAGFNPTGKPNAVIEMVDHQINQSLDAQKQNLQSSHNLLRANLDHFKNLKDATDMTRIMLNEAALTKIQQAASQAKTPMALANAQMAIGPLQKQQGELRQNLQIRQTMMGLSNQNGGVNDGAIQGLIGLKRASGDEAGAHALEEHYVPGIGYSPNQAVPPAIREKLLAHKQMDMQVRDLHNWVQTHSTLIPGTPDYNVGEQKAMALQSAVREGMLRTVYREGEQPLLDKMINSNPAGILKNLKTMPQLNELLSSNERSFNVLKSGYGLPITASQSQQSAAIKTMGGVKYQQGPNGWTKVK